MPRAPRKDLNGLVSEAPHESGSSQKSWNMFESFAVFDDGLAAPGSNGNVNVLPGIVNAFPPVVAAMPAPIHRCPELADEADDEVCKAASDVIYTASSDDVSSLPEQTD